MTRSGQADTPLYTEDYDELILSSVMRQMQSACPAEGPCICDFIGAASWWPPR
jgi:hypothetical protein